MLGTGLQHVLMFVYAYVCVVRHGIGLIHCFSTAYSEAQIELQPLGLQHFVFWVVVIRQEVSQAIFPVGNVL